ncbi:MAG: TRAP transporter large permease [Firmicutes bacterium]|nr:TRAP transporter large permease [Bacillota bacterium]
MAFVGILGYAYLVGWENAALMAGMEPFSQTAYHPITAVPLFLLMGAIVSVTGISTDLYDAARKWIGQVRGGLAMATVAACGGFAAICGDSIATAVTMGKVAFPEMKRYNYDAKLAVGSIAAGGTIGILIPPSLGFILYGILTEQSIGQLFIAGIVPGILEVLFYMVTIFFICRINPLLGPPGPRVAFREKVVGLKNIWPMLVIFLLIIVGLYAGIFTPTEAGAIGAFGAVVVTLVLRRLKWNYFSEAVTETAGNTSMIVFLLIGAFMLTRFLTVSQLPVMLGQFIVGLQVPKLLILLAIIGFYLITGCFLDVLAAIILTLPITYPIIIALGYNPIWWGVIMVRVMEVGMISPPIGINVFVLAKTTDTSIGTIYRGVLPFIVADIVHIALLVAVPELSLFLVKLM